MQLFGPLYERVMRWSRHRHAERYLALLSFSESSFFPIPVDVMLAPMVMADRDKAWRFAAVAAVFSVLGGVAGYAIGWGMFEAIQPWLSQSHYWDAYLTSRQWFDDYGVWVVFVAGFSPIPYKVFTIAAGVAVLNLPGFIIASAIGRGARFFLVAGLVYAFGKRFEETMLKHIERIGWAMVVLTIIVIAWLMMRG
ncbi:MAG: YqaA family protein [Woeseiaceae bacterium]|nr:YqaA family protein [Woeseiaceae bacterium]